PLCSKPTTEGLTRSTGASTICATSGAPSSAVWKNFSTPASNTSNLTTNPPTAPVTARVDAPSKTKPGSKIELVFQRVPATISRHSLFPTGTRVIAAVSGGPDSVCLLHVLRDVSRDMQLPLTGIAHFNHKLRGEASDEDERF